jgi:hypothetical protein
MPNIILSYSPFDQPKTGLKKPLACKTMYLIKNSGGLNFVNIEYKLYALRLKHIQDIIVNRNTKFVNFSIYWIGLKRKCPLA